MVVCEPRSRLLSDTESAGALISKNQFKRNPQTEKVVSSKNSAGKTGEIQA